MAMWCFAWPLLRRSCPCGSHLSECGEAPTPVLSKAWAPTRSWRSCADERANCGAGLAGAQRPISGTPGAARSRRYFPRLRLIFP